MPFVADDSIFEDYAVCDFEKWERILVGQQFVNNRGTYEPTDSSITLPNNRRILPWGCAMTLDYVIERLNIELDQELTVQRVWYD